MKTPPNSKPFRLEIERLRTENERLRETAEKLARAEAALREIAGQGLPVGSLPVCHRCKSLRDFARAYFAEVQR